MLFCDEAPEIYDRISLAAEAGFDAIEFWRWSEREVNRLADAAAMAQIPISAMVGEPMIPLTRPENQNVFLEGLGQSIEVARILKCPTLIVQTGNYFEDLEFETQQHALINTLKKAGELLEGSGVRIGVEPLNTLIDHPGYFLHDTKLACTIIDSVDHECIGLTYDLYHSMVMSEDPQEVVKNHIKKIFHLHIADHPGRNEPGSGKLNLSAQLRWLKEKGYRNYVGHEYRPRSSTREALRFSNNGI